MIYHNTYVLIQANFFIPENLIQANFFIPENHDS